MRVLVVEALGTAVVVAAACAVGSDGGPLTPLVVPAVFTALLLATEPLGGGFFNPAVAAAAWISGLVGGRHLLSALGGQAVGIGAGVAWGLSVVDTPPPVVATATRQAVVAEAGVTATLVLVTLLALAGSRPAERGDDRPGRPPGGGRGSAAVPAGLVLLAGTLTVGPVSGAAFNPAVAAGLVGTGHLPWTAAAAYVPVQLLAGVAAAVTAAVLRRLPHLHGQRPPRAASRVSTGPEVAGPAPERFRGAPVPSPRRPGARRA